MSVTHSDTRGSIYLEDAVILDHQHHEGDQHIVRLDAPRCAEHAQAGQFVHIQCDPSLPLRRPLSIMRTNNRENWVDLLYKDVGQGTHLLANRAAGDTLSMLGPIGNVFQLSEVRPIRVLIGGGVGIPPMIFLAETIASLYPDDVQNTLVIMGSETPFPFEIEESSTEINGIARETNASIAALGALNIPSRLSSLQGYAGCHQGYAPDLARQYLQSLQPSQLSRIEIFSCGPHPMLAAVKQLAQDLGINCQVSLEERMACAVGGCAGCVVEVATQAGSAMKRVCVDGPVFDAQTIHF
ncbi:MAG: dihydroorotate dehydrogenase electron transfer subunit [Gammaproteobacteria bacterium]|nr:dihydroorotate dehydrogenase electron transfer subunit [Gammaproteobacteria bacterium]